MERWLMTQTSFLDDERPEGTYHTVMADPPWRMMGGGGRSAAEHYPLMTAEEIYETFKTCEPHARVHPDSHLWLWVTNNFLRDGLWLMEELGYRYVTNLVWVKADPVPREGLVRVQIGMGQYLRGSHELCLFGVRGRAMMPEKAPPSVVLAPRGRHSAKPLAARRAIEQASPGPRLEMFARERFEGWDAWGNEV